MHGLKRARNAIERAGSIAISGHINPDGDSIGSMLALGLGLERLGKRVQMISRDSVPHRYRALPGAREIRRKLTPGPIDLAVAVDCGSREMLGETFSSFESASDILEIDHHIYRRPFGSIAMIDREAAAVGETIYVLLNALGVDIDREIAQNLLTSIIVETNSFRLPNTRRFTFEVCSDLISRGVDFYRLVETVFWSRRSESAVLSGLCLSRCKFLMGGRLAWSIIRSGDFESAGGKDEDVDPVPDEMRSIDRVRVAVLFREKDPDTLRVSLRSKARINVASLAERYGGGGHSDVAGCSIRNSASDMRKLLKEAGRLVG